jgi:hypothetical protein
MVLGRWVARLISFQGGWWSSRAVCTVSRSCSLGMLQRPSPMSVRALSSRSWSSVAVDVPTDVAMGVHPHHGIDDFCQHGPCLAEHETEDSIRETFNNGLDKLEARGLQEWSGRFFGS